MNKLLIKTKLLLITMLSAVFILSPLSAAEWQSTNKVTVKHLSNSDDDRTDSLGVIYKRENTDEDLDKQDYFAIEAYHHDIQEEGRRYDGDNIKAKGGKWVTQHTYVEGYIGSDRLHVIEDNRKKNELIYGIEIDSSINKHVKVIVKHDDGLPYLRDIIETEDGQLLGMRTTSAALEITPTERSRLEAAYEQRRLSDGNRAEAGTVGVHYGVSSSKPWLWVGLEGRTLDYDREDSGYSTPQNERTVAATLTASTEITDNLNVWAYASAGRSKDDQVEDYTEDYYLSIGANYTPNENIKLEANIEGGRSLEESDTSIQRGGSVAVTFKHL